MRRTTHLTAAALLLATGATAQQLPEGPGKAELQKVCSQCHELARSVSMRQDRAGWSETVQKMAALGAKSTPEELKAVIDYLADHYPAGELPGRDRPGGRADTAALASQVDRQVPRGARPVPFPGGPEEGPRCGHGQNRGEEGPPHLSDQVSNSPDPVGVESRMPRVHLDLVRGDFVNEAT